MRRIGRTGPLPAGPVLYVCNPIMGRDAALVLGPALGLSRCLVERGRGLGPLGLGIARRLGVDLLARDAGREDHLRSLAAARGELEQGRAVCLSTEGPGVCGRPVLSLQERLDELTAGLAVPIVPVYLDHPRRSLVHRAVRWLPVSIGWGRWAATLGVGEPLPPGATAYEVRLRVQELGADCFEARKPFQRPLHRQFVRVAARRPWRFCMADSMGRTLSYGQALAGSMVLARLLARDLGVEPMVGLMLPTSVPTALANIACLLAGKVPVNLNFTSSDDALASAIAQCQIRRVISSRRFLDHLQRPVPAGAEVLWLEDYKDRVRWWTKLGALARAYLVPGVILDRWVLGLGRHRIDDLATVIFTSGSTGEPKGVMLSHHNIVSNLEPCIDVIDVRADERMLGILPLFHAFGFTVTFWMPLLVARSVVFHVSPLDAPAIGKLCQKYRATVLAATPTFLRTYQRRCRPDQLASLRVILTGAEKLHVALARSFAEQFGICPIEGYGGTELAPVAAVNISEAGCSVADKSGKVGRPIPGVAVKIVDPDTFEPRLAGQQGLLLVRGPNVMAGYLGRPDVTARVIRDGWYVTGDIGTIDHDGFIELTDRLARFSKVGGEMVPHIGVEDAIRAILGTDDPVCAVTGLADGRKGERLVVVHTPLGMAVDDLWRRLQATSLPRLWLPARHAFIEVSEIPLLGTGKLDLRQIRAIAEARCRPELAPGPAAVLSA